MPKYTVIIGGKERTIDKDKFDGNVEAISAKYPDAKIKAINGGTEGMLPVSNYSKAIQQGYRMVEMNDVEPVAAPVVDSSLVQQRDSVQDYRPVAAGDANKPFDIVKEMNEPTDTEKRETERKRIEEQAVQAKKVADSKSLHSKDEMIHADAQAIRENPFSLVTELLTGTTVLTPKQVEVRKRAELNRATSEKSDDTLNLIEEAKKKGDTTFVSGFGRGFWEKASKASTWDFGARDLQSNLVVSAAAKKYSEGVPLSAEEETLLDAVALEAAAQGEFSGDLGRGYKAGGTTAESIPFMAEFMINPATGTGKVIGKVAAKKLITNFGKEAAKSTIGKIARSSARVAGDVAGAGIMAGTTGVMRTSADAVDRMTGEVKPTIDADGYYRFGGTEEGDSGMKAFAKAYGASTIENFSEMFGNYLVPMGAAVGELAGRSMKRIGLGKVNDIIGRVRSSDIAKIVDDFQGRTQWNGTIGEYLEEQAGMAMNALTVGDNQLSDLVDVDTQIDTFLGVSAFGGLFSGIKTGGYAREKYVQRKRMNEADREASGATGEEWQSLKGRIDGADDAELVSILTSTMNDENLGDKQKQDVLLYAGRLKAYHGANLADLKRKTEGDTPDEVVQAQMNFDAGYKLAEADRKEKRRAAKELDKVERKLDDDFLSADESGQYDLMRQRVEAGEDVSDELTYINSLSRFNGMIHGIRDVIDEKVGISNQYISGVTHQDGNVYDVTLSGDVNKHVFPVSGAIVVDENGIVNRKHSDSRFIVRDENGKVEMRSVDDLYKMESMDNAEVLKEVSAQSIREQESARYAEEIETPDVEEKAEEVGALQSGSEVTLNVGGVAREAVVQNVYSDGGIELRFEDKITGHDGKEKNVDVFTAEEVTALLVPKEEMASEEGNVKNGTKNEAKVGENAGVIEMNDEKSDIIPAVEVEAESLPGEELLPDAVTESEDTGNSVPVDEKGNLLYHRAPVEVTLESVRSYGLDEAETDEFVSAQKSDASKRLEKLQKGKPKVGTNLAKYQAEKKAWEDSLADAQAQADYWDEVDAQVLATRVQPGDMTAEAINSMGDPMNGEEFAAMMLGTRKLPLLFDDYKLETGFSSQDAKRMLGLFAGKANGGMSIEQAGEKLMEMDAANGTGFFDQTDANAGRNAVLEVLSSSRTRGDLFGYIKGNREIMAAEERRAEYSAYEQWVNNVKHMSVAEYEADEETIESRMKEISESFNFDEINGDIADDLIIEENDRRTKESGVEPITGGGAENIQGEFDGSAESGGVGRPEISGVIGESQEWREGSADENGISGADVVGTQQSGERIGESLFDYAQRIDDSRKIAQAEKIVDTEPTEAQKEAGNYKMGHVKIGGYDVTIENPKGSVRRGVGADGKSWETPMNNTYGYFRGTKGKDGDHVDVFLGVNLKPESVYVVDQVNEDGSFDEHKVMYGFDSAEDARAAYLSNYEDGWQGLGELTEAPRDVFDEWLRDGKKKQKPFAEYVNAQNSNSEATVVNEEYHSKDGSHILYTHNGALPFKKGEFCHVERVFTESGAFLFTGKGKIESADDVAYIFKELENASVENSFAVLVKNNKPTIIHLGMGSFVSTAANIASIKAAYSAIGADSIYFVHNHPSGNLKCSRQDIAILKGLSEMFESEDVIVQDGIIINTTSGKYGTFNLEGGIEETKRPDNQAELPLKLYAFDRLVFSKDYDASNLSTILSSEDIASLVSSQRLGERDKVSYMILDNANHVLGNIHTEFSSIKENENTLADEIARNVIRFGGTSAAIYGDFDMKEFSPSALNSKIKRLSAGNVQLLDCVSVNGINTRSAVDDNLMDPKESYGNENRIEDENLFESAERIVEKEKINRDYDSALNVVNEFSEKCAGACKTLVVKSKELLRKQLEAVNIKPKDIDKYEKWTNDGNVIAFYHRRYGRIIILDTSYSKEELKTYLWHENVHAALDGMDNQNDVIDRIVTLIDKHARFIIDKVNDAYAGESERVRREEYVTRFFEELVRSGKEPLMLQGDVRLVDAEANDAISEILNYINNGRKESNDGLGGNVQRRKARNDGRGGSELDREVRDSDDSIGSDAGGGRVWNDLRSILEAGEERLRRKDESESSGSGIGSQSLEESEGVAKQEYEDSLDKAKNKMYRWQEAYQDSMLGLKKMQEAIEKESGEKLQYFEDAYMAENQMSSRSGYETDVYKDKFFVPMMDAVRALVKNGAKQKDVSHYVMAKHGLERNVVFAKRDAERAVEDEFSDELSELNKLWDKGEIELELFDERIEELNARKIAFHEEVYQKNRKRDYSGLKQLTDEEENFEEAAMDLVDAFEDAHSSLCDALWEKVNAATKQTLKKSYESGLMAKSTYDKIRGMFEYYVPLRGWDDKVASDVYEYVLSERSVFQAPIKTAFGRESLADDPFANIGNMAESGILQGNRNLMKQKFLNMVLNHPTSLATVKTMWYENAGSSESPVWEQSFPYIKPDATAEEISQAIDDHEARMAELGKSGMAKKSTKGVSLDYRASTREINEHIVVVKSGGREHVIFVNGNPRAAQAINGLTNPDTTDHKFMQTIGKANRQLAANFTTRNPAFVLSNMSRDVIFSTSAIWVKEDWKYAKRFDKNIAKNIGGIVGLMARYKSGKLDMRNQRDRYFLEFLENGGETGYTALHNVDEYKKMMNRYVRKSDGALGSVNYGLHAIVDSVSFMNRCAENVSRFTTYQTSREMGRGIAESVRDAKEVTVNFNKKGAGGLGAGTIKSLFLFFNAAVQSLSNFKGLHDKSKPKFYATLGGFAAAGILLPMINNAIIEMLVGDGDDEMTDEERAVWKRKRDSYDNLPEWVRKNNFCLWTGGENFITIPLPIELRAFYGLGEMWYQMGRGNMNGVDGKLDVGRASLEMVNQLTELLPINPLGGNGDAVSVIIPDAGKPIYQVFANRDFFGKPIYKKNDRNELMPAWTKAFSGTAKWMVNSAEFINEVSGGDKYVSGGVDLNPATIEHVFEGYFGGMGKTANQLFKTLTMIWDEDERMWRNVPVANRFYTGSDNKISFRKVNEEYYRYMEEYDETEQRLKGYENEAEMGIEEYAEKYDFLSNSKQNERYEVMKEYKKAVDELYSAIKESDPGEKKETEMEINLLKIEMIEEVGLIE